MSAPNEELLLTGVPSFSAGLMLREVLREEGTQVHLVVRPKQHEALESLFESLLAEIGAGFKERVHVLEGDPTHIDFGLSGAEFNDLRKRVTRIHHMSEVIAPSASKEIATQGNINSVREVLELARVAPRLESLVAHSTALVSGKKSGLVQEEDLDLTRGFRNVVEETKARGERMLREAMRDVPISIVRPSITVGSSQTGEIDRFEGPYLLILLMMSSPRDWALPLPGRGDSPLHLVPIDFVVRASRAIGLDPAAKGKTFHLVDPHPLTAKRIFELVADAAGKRSPRGFIPANLTKAILRTPGLDRFAKSPRAFIDALGANVWYDSKNTEALLTPKGITCPPFPSYVDKLVEYIDHRLRSRRSTKDDAFDALDGVT